MKKKKVHKKITLYSIFVHTFLLLIAFTSIYPFYWMIVSSTLQVSDTHNPKVFPLPGPYLIENLSRFSDFFSLKLVMFNTIFVTVVGTVGQVLIISMAAYALAKYDFKGKKLFFFMLIFTLFITGQVNLIPRFELVKSFGIYDTLAAIIIPGLFSVYSTFLIRQNLLSFPDEMIEAARIDGMGEIGIFFKIVIQNIPGAIATITVLSFMEFWNGYLWNLIAVQSPAKYTIQVALATFRGQSDLYAGLLTSGSAMATIPILILFFALQKYFMPNILSGSIK